jgi:hypothetical protein
MSQENRKRGMYKAGMGLHELDREAWVGDKMVLLFLQNMPVIVVSS